MRNICFASVHSTNTFHILRPIRVGCGRDDPGPARQSSASAVARERGCSSVALGDPDQLRTVPGGSVPSGSHFLSTSSGDPGGVGMADVLRPISTGDARRRCGTRESVHAARCSGNGTSVMLSLKRWRTKVLLVLCCSNLMQYHTVDVVPLLRC